MSATVLPADRLARLAAAFKRRRGLLRTFTRNTIGQALVRRVQRKA
ncbi:MAG: hypothetical protein WBF99_01260 [Xanthobacteraceae bacterium]